MKRSTQATHRTASITTEANVPNRTITATTLDKRGDVIAITMEYNMWHDAVRNHKTAARHLAFCLGKTQERETSGGDTLRVRLHHAPTHNKQVFTHIIEVYREDAIIFNY